MLIAAELYLRLMLGLGDPPLWRTDPDYEYIAQASHSCKRFGNRIAFNSWSMRSREANQNKTDPNELRVLVLGDSVINGVPAIDQNQLCTTLLESRLQKDVARPLWVGNISAGSWGPPNLLGYVKKHGLFDADIVIIEINSADYFKQLEFRELDPSRPSRKPPFALWEVVSKYVRRAVRKRLRKKIREAKQAARTGEQSESALRELIALIQKSGAALIVMQHLERDEIINKPHAGYEEFGAIVRSFGGSPVNLGPAFSAALEKGDEPYNDDIHPNALGHKLLADAMHKAIRESNPSLFTGAKP